MKLYISGPMFGYPGHNFPAFGRARKALRAMQYVVVCPAELGKCDGWEWKDYLKRDLKVMLDCDGVATLEGWEDSRGATLEVYVAHALSLDVAPVEKWLLPHRTFIP